MNIVILSSNEVNLVCIYLSLSSTRFHPSFFGNVKKCTKKIKRPRLKKHSNHFGKNVALMAFNHASTESNLLKDKKKIQEK
jgi:hypothetical protein